MTIKNIIQKIEAETKTEVDNILQDARDEANSLRAGSEKAVRLGRLREQGKKRITIMRNIHLSEARRTKRRTILGAKEELINDCFEQAKGQLKELKGTDYQKVIKRLLDESKALIGANGIVTITREEDRAFITTIPNIKVKSDLASGLGGFIIESSDGKIVVDNTFDAILDRQKEDVRTSVANILYPE